MRAYDRDLIRGGHYGQRSCEPHSKAEHMAAPTNAAFVKKALANPEPSTHGPRADICSAQLGCLLRAPCAYIPAGLRTEIAECLVCIAYTEREIEAANSHSIQSTTTTQRVGGSSVDPGCWGGGGAGAGVCRA